MIKTLPDHSTQAGTSPEHREVRKPLRLRWHEWSGLRAGPAAGTTPEPSLWPGIVAEDGVHDAIHPLPPEIPHGSQDTLALEAGALQRSLLGDVVGLKKVRYTTEVSPVALGDAGPPFARALARLQDVLGAQQDAVVTEAWLRRAAEAGDTSIALVAGRFVAVESDEAAQSREEWPSAWKAVRKAGQRSAL